MAQSIEVRLVNVEFLRPGPPQNQLLSPLTQYLAICGDAGAGVVTVPYEHATFERKLKELRYETGDPADRLAMLHDIGVDMGRLLGAVPGLPGSLAIGADDDGMLVHLRLTVSASELALLPFEFAKVPVGPNATADEWLALKTRPPVAVTRHIRNVSAENTVWPHRPRVLFVAGDPDVIPFAEHRAALLAATRPFAYPGRDDPTTSRDGMREQFGELLTILVNPTLNDVLRECREARYTHVHLLTHGDFDDAASDSFGRSYGLVLRGSESESDVVSGERFSTALAAITGGRIHRPTVVTVASCDSGNVGSVVRPGASFAHALHQGGVPLVVASQFPLSIEGSVPLVETLYRGLLWGGHPLVLLQQIRAELHARHTSRWHDWASLVVYEAMPRDIAQQLERTRYYQARRAIEAALETIDAAVERSDPARSEPDVPSLVPLFDATEQALGQLPTEGPFVVESIGLRASAHKRLAQASFALAARTVAVPWKKDCCDLLDEARIDYERAVRCLLVGDGRTLQRVATLHWLAVQLESLRAVLGKPTEEGSWEAAKLCADLYAEHSDLEERAWAQGSLAELWLLKLARSDAGAVERDSREAGERVLRHARELARMYPSRDAFPVTSTRRQFARYLDWWGAPRFERDLDAHGLDRGARWGGPGGLMGLAARVVEILQPRAPAKPSLPPTQDGNAKPSTPPSADTRPAKPSTPSAVRPRRSAKPRDGAFFDLRMLPAGHGDCLWIEYGDAGGTHRWLIDGGTQASASGLLRQVGALSARDREFELLVLSHIDSDHIGGALPLMKAVQNGLRFGDVWFNGWQHLSGRLGAKQGEMFSSAIEDLHLPWNAWRQGHAIVVGDGDLPSATLPGGMTLTLLSPTPAQLSKLAPAWTQELKKAGLVPGSHVDYSRFLRGSPSSSTDVDKLADTPFAGDAAPANGSSIAVLAEFGGASVLFGADAHDPVLVESVRRLLRQRGLDRLKLDALKVSHHASQNNLSKDFLALIDCKRYCISTNGDYFCHPDREAIGRIIKYGGERPELWFNYSTRYNEVWKRPDLQERYRYSARYPDTPEDGVAVSLLAASG
jgi:beta-lactamase superfamily II metal-dependent hydrolase